MGHTVHFSPAVQQVIGSWTLPRGVSIAIRTRLLVDLPADPDRYLVNRVPPYADAFDFTLVLADHQSFPPLHTFTFIVRRDDVKKELRVVSAQHSTEVPGTN